MLQQFLYIGALQRIALQAPSDHVLGVPPLDVCGVISFQRREDFFELRLADLLPGAQRVLVLIHQQVVVAGILAKESTASAELEQHDTKRPHIEAGRCDLQLLAAGSSGACQLRGRIGSGGLLANGVASVRGRSTLWFSCSRWWSPESVFVQ